MLLDIPMSDLSFSSEQRSPAPASVNGVLGDGASFSLVLNASSTAVPKAAQLSAQIGAGEPLQDASAEGVPAPLQRTLLAVSMVKAQLNFADMAPIKAGQSVPETSTAPLNPLVDFDPLRAQSGTVVAEPPKPVSTPVATPTLKSVEQALMAPIVSRIQAAAPGMALPQDAQVLPDHGNVMPEKFEAEKPALAPSVLSHLQLAPQKPDGQPAKLSLQERPLLQSPAPLNLGNDSIQTIADPAIQPASSTVVHYHVGGNPMLAQTVLPESNEPEPIEAEPIKAEPIEPEPTEAEPSIPLSRPNVAAPPQLGQSVPNNSPPSLPIAPVLRANMPVEQSDIPSQRRMQSPQTPAAAPPVSVPAELARSVQMPADLPLVSQTPQAVETLKQTETLRQSTLGFEAERADTPIKPAIKAPAILPPAILPSGQLPQERERIVPVGVNRDLDDLQPSVLKPRPIPQDAASRIAAQSPKLKAPQTAKTAPKIAVDPNALALPVEKPVSGTALSAPIPAPSATTMQAPVSMPMPIGMPLVDAPISNLSNGTPAPLPGAPQLRDAQPLERLVETISQMRESGQTGRGEVSLRHNQFGLVSMQVQSSDGELQARLASRDPGFVAAAQLALAERAAAERAVMGASDTAQTASRGNESQQNQNQQNGNNQGRDMGSMGQSDGRQGGTASGDEKPGDTSTKGEHDAALSSPDDHTAPKDASITQATNGLFA